MIVASYIVFMQVLCVQKSTLSNTFKRKRQQKAAEFSNSYIVFLVLMLKIFIPTDPILADDKTVEEQYNFSVKPHILYLK